MKRTYIPLLLLSLLTVFLTACATETERPPAAGDREGRWEAVSADYRPVSYDPCDAIAFPRFEGKTREEWEAYSISIGQIDNSFLTWALKGDFSPNGRYLSYISDKDCLALENTMSVLLLDMNSGTERVLLSGKDGTYNSTLAWLDDTTLLCESTSRDADGNPVTRFVLCDVTGKIMPTELAQSDHGPYPFAMQGRMIAYLSGEEGKSITLVRIEADGTITGAAQKEFDGYPVNFGGISPDGKWVMFPLRSNWEEVERNICLWNTESGAVTLLENPTPTEGSDLAAIAVHWKASAASPEIEFNISDAPDSNGHNELWRYVF